MTVAQTRVPANKDSNAIRTTSQKHFEFEVVSIRPLKPGFTPYDKAPAPVGNMMPSPSGFSSTMAPGMMVQLAYGGRVRSPIDNMPDWFANWYFINARVANKDLVDWQNQNDRHELLRLAMQAVLRERFKLAIHERPVEIPEYALVIKRKGTRFKPSLPGAVLPQGKPLSSGGVRTFDLSGGQILKVHFYGATMGDLVDFLRGNSPNRPVRDATGLTGHYDFTLELAPGPRPEPEEAVFMYPVAPLGLQLKPIMTPSHALVIDHVEHPSPN